MLGLSCDRWDLFPQPGMESRPPALRAWSLSHWTTREVPRPILVALFFLLGFPGGSDGKESTCIAGDLDSISGLGRSPGGGPTPVFLPGESPRTEEPDRLQSMGLQSIGHDWMTKHSTFFLQNLGRGLHSTEEKWLYLCKNHKNRESFLPYKSCHA